MSVENLAVKQKPKLVLVVVLMVVVVVVMVVAVVLPITYVANKFVVIVCRCSGR